MCTSEANLRKVCSRNVCSLPSRVVDRCHTRSSDEVRVVGRVFVFDSILVWVPRTFGQVVVQSLGRVRLFATPWTAARQAYLSITISQRLLKRSSTKSVMPSNHLSLCRPLVLPPSIFPSIRVFSTESALCISWPKDWSFSFSISPSNEHSGLISFRMDWLHLLAVQGTLESLLQHHGSKAPILQRSAFFMVQLSHPYVIKSVPIKST